ncbi:unnamed protein product [Gadus morhua 'NCC']
MCSEIRNQCGQERLSDLLLLSIEKDIPIDKEELHLPPLEIQGEGVTGTVYRQPIPAGQELEMITDVGSTASMVCSQRSFPDKSRE